MTNSNPAPIEPENLVRDYLLSSRAYDVIKWLALIGLPALGSLYFALAQIWGLPNAEKVVGTIMVIDTFLGALLSLSAKSYNASEAKYDGAVEIEQTETGAKVYSLVLNGDIDKIEEQSQLVFKINPS